MFPLDIFVQTREIKVATSVEGNDPHSESESSGETQVFPSELSDEAKLKLEIIESLSEPCDRKTYGAKLEEAARKLNKSKRTVQRLVKQWEDEGLMALQSSERADKGSYRIDQQLHELIVKTYREGNRGSKRMTRKQVYLRVKAQAAKLGLKPPSHMTVYRVLKPIIEKAEQKKSIRSPGWRGSQLSLKTRAGQDLSVEYSNHVWQCDHTLADILLVDQHGQQLGRPWLTTVIDSYSRCIMGINLGFDAYSSQVVALVLRHAILPKQYKREYGLHCEWGTYGKPEHFYTDGGTDFCSKHLRQIGAQLGFTSHLRHHPSEGGIVERPFGTLNTALFSTLPGYTGPNVQQRPKDAEKDACLTLRQLEQVLVRYIVDNYNQSLDARMGDQTRFQRWESGLLATPHIFSERELDICLMKKTKRSVQRGGYLQFENLMYRGEHLAGYAGENVILRYDPKDITTILVYQNKGNQEEFLARAYAQYLETETLSLEEAKASSRKLRETGKQVTNRSILAEVLDRETFSPRKKTKKERRKIEQASLKKSQEPIRDEPEDIEAEPISDSFDPESIEVLDYEQMREDYGW